MLNPVICIVGIQDVIWISYMDCQKKVSDFQGRARTTNLVTGFGEILLK